LKKKKIPLRNDSGDFQLDSTHPASLPAIIFPQQPDQSYERKELSHFIQGEINKLSPAYKVVITLFHLDGLSIQEIAKIMKQPEGTIKSYLFRARKHLKTRLLKIYQNEELVS